MPLPLTQTYNTNQTLQIIYFKPLKKHTMEQRQLTGKWYLKKTILGTYKIKVQVQGRSWSDPSYGNGGGSYSPETIYYEDARDEDILALKIRCV